MWQVYKKILAPIDGSDYSLRALKQAAMLAQKTEAKLTIVHVVELPAHLEKYGKEVKEIADEAMQSASELIQRAKNEECAGYAIPVKEKIFRGEPASEIIREAQRGRYDLIVISSRGLGKVKGWLLGSVSQKVIKYAKCSVLVVR